MVYNTQSGALLLVHLTSYDLGVFHSVNTDCCSGICDGCQVEGKVNMEIVDFALSQLLGPDKKCFYVKTENFQSQVNLNVQL